MKRLAVIFYSRSGNTEKMAKLVADGAKGVSETEVDVVRVDDIKPEKVLDYDGLIIGSPTYYGSMAGEIKKFFDETVKYHGKLDGKVGAAFSSAANIGGGNETTISDILNAMLIHGMIVQGNPKGDHFGPVSIGAPDGRVQEQCRELGQRVASLLKRMG